MKNNTKRSDAEITELENTRSVINYQKAGADNSLCGEALGKLRQNLIDENLISELYLYLAGDLEDSFKESSGYWRSAYLVSQRFSDRDKSLNSIAKEMFCYYGVMVLGFSHSGFQKAIKECFSKVELEKLTAEIASAIKDRFMDFELSVPATALER